MKNIIIFSCWFLLSLPTIHSQETISGEVIDKYSHEAIINADVKLKGTKGVETTTDIEGKFTLEVDEYFPVVIVISYTGYKTKEVTISNRDFVKVKLKAHSQIRTLEIYVDYAPINLNIPAHYIYFEKKQLTRDNDFEINSALNRIPGIFMQTGGLNMNRISMRGIGARSNLSTRKIRLYFEDIPLTAGNGSSAIEEIDMSIFKNVRVWSGPTGSTLGAGLGGAIQLKTTPSEIFRDYNYVSTKLTGGSFGLIRNATDFAHYNRKGNAEFRINLNTTHNDGYRENSNFNRKGFTLMGKFRENRINQTSILVNYSKGDALNPYALNKIDLDYFPQKANKEYKEIEANDEYDNFLIGITHMTEIAYLKNKSFRNKTSIFGNFKNSEEKNPKYFLDNKREMVGVRTSFELSYNFSSTVSPLFTIGMELIRENSENDISIIDKEKGLPTGNFSNLNNNLNFFTHSYLYFRSHWLLSYGVNLNQTKNSYSRKNLSVGNVFKNEKILDWVLSPKVGLSYRKLRYATLFTSLSHGFSPPTVNQIFPTNGNHNDNLQSEKGLNFEIGVRGNNLFRRYIISLYASRVNDFLVDSFDSNLFLRSKNSGKTSHQGIEAYLEQTYFESISGLKAFISYSYKQSKFKEYNDGENDYSGNKIPGVPPHHLNLGLKHVGNKGLYWIVNFQHVSQFQINDSNTNLSDSYNLLNAKIGYQKHFKNDIKLEVFAGVRNLTNEKYASLIRVNENNYSSSILTEYYYPGLPINFYGGIELKKKLRSYW